MKNILYSKVYSFINNNKKIEKILDFSYEMFWAKGIDD